MYLVSFDVGRFQRKKDGSKRRTRAHATETIRYDPFGVRSRICPLGSVTYDMLKVDSNSKTSVTAFIRKWIDPNYLPSFGEHHLVKVLGGEELSDFKSGQSDIRYAIREWLLIDERSAITKSLALSGVDDKDNWIVTWGHVDHDRESLSGRFRYCPLRPEVSAKITLTPVYSVSKRTRYRQQAKLRRLEEEQNKLSAAQNRLIQRMDEVRPILKAPEVDAEYDAIPRHYYELTKAHDVKRVEYMKEYGKGWDVTVEYEVPDIISLCWLELFTCVQHGIPARLCSLCQRYFIVTGRANMRQCPECRKNPAKAWRKANESVLNEDGSSED